MGQFDKPLNIEIEEQKGKYHSRDVMRFLGYRMNPETLQFEAEQGISKAEVARLMSRRRANLPNSSEIERRLKEISDKEGNFPKNKLKDVLVSQELADEFERGWEKVPGSTFDDRFENDPDYPKWWS